MFLIALPLCLGIATASGFPPMSGIISAIVGGLLVSRINGSQLTVTGPAAGLIVVIFNAVQALGDGDAWAGYRYTLAAIVVAGLLQIVLGYFKAGRLAGFFPASVAHGMLAAIGLIIIVKQLPVIAGLQLHGNGLPAAIAQLPQTLTYFVPTTGLIGLAGIVTLLAWPYLRHPLLRRIPAPIVVIGIGVLMGKLFGLERPHLEYAFVLPSGLDFAANFLVAIPAGLADSLQLPDFGKLASWPFWESVIAICLIGSLESLLSAAAVDKLDPARRYSDLNRELTAIGVGNAVSGMLGGLPMIAEIVRSSANIDAGARSSWANFFHGGFLLLFVVLFPHWIAAIPLASLAALLVYTGYRLASPKVFAKSMDLGKEQLALFLITIVAILAGNLLSGVLIGIGAKILLHLGRGVPLANLLSLSYHLRADSADQWTVKVDGSALFSNFLALKSQLATLGDGKTVIFDLSGAELIDHTVMEFIDSYRTDYTARGGRCEIRGLENLQALGEHALAARKRA
ncbi:sulfate transporter [Methylomonas koyamae]|nr:sulfate transporter [Methylomonas koyamae]